MKLQQRCGCCTNAQLIAPFAVASLISGEVDHKIPLILGGHHCLKNLWPLTVEEHRLKTKQDLRRIADARLRSRLFKSWQAPVGVSL
jgi:5-methylcytosine-specific restriction endonuclease McrA